MTEPPTPGPATTVGRDQLTGLLDRAGFLSHGQRSVAGGAHTAALIMVNIDRFRDINAGYGQDSGDELLRRVGRALHDLTTGRAFAARLGRDQFAILTVDPASWWRLGQEVTDSSLIAIAEQVRKAVRGPFRLPGIGLDIEVEASVGVAYEQAPHAAVPVLMHRADAAMYQAKTDRTGVELWTAQLDTVHRDDLQLLAELRHAIPDGQLRLHYQPIIDAGNGSIHGVEALVRWQHPQHGLVQPSGFLPQAERSDVILPLTDWVLDTAIEQIGAWMRQGRRLPVSVNVSAASLAQPTLPTTVERLLDTHDVPGELLTVEVTESAVMTRPDRAAARLTALRERGVRVSIDDFGTGYTSLLLLTQLPIDELKLDRAFVSRLNHSASHGAIVQAVAAMARGLGVTTVAEGVEDEATAESLRGLGFSQLQGFHFARPAPPDEIFAKGERPQQVPHDVIQVLAAAASTRQVHPTQQYQRNDPSSRAPAASTLVIRPDPGRRRALDALAAGAAAVCHTRAGLLVVLQPGLLQIRGAAGLPRITVLEPAGSPLWAAVEQNRWFVVGDASVDPRFAGNSLVHGGGLRFYAGAPLRHTDGAAFGVLCVLDRDPHRIGQAQQQAVEALADRAAAMLTGRDGQIPSIGPVTAALALQKR
jgi:diguanylate cyclase (GGDEF)-like protein